MRGWLAATPLFFGMRKPRTYCLLPAALALAALAMSTPRPGQQPQRPSPIRFELRNLPFRLKSHESQARNAPETKAGVQSNHQTSSVCYASSSLGPVHFGLGAEGVAAKVEITWPSGIVQTLEDVAAGRIVKVTEPVPAPPPAK